MTNWWLCGSKRGGAELLEGERRGRSGIGLNSGGNRPRLFFPGVGGLFRSCGPAVGGPEHEPEMKWIQVTTRAAGLLMGICVDSRWNE